MKHWLFLPVFLLCAGCELPFGKWEKTELLEVDCGDLFQGTVFKMINRDVGASKYEDTQTGKEVVLPDDCSLVLLELYDG